jgi:hypothetical protein
MKIKPQTTILVAAFIVVSGIVLTSSLGLWQTESTKIPQKLKQEQYSQQYNPAEIKGSYTFSEISTLFNISIEELANAFLVEESVAQNFKCKDLESIFTNETYEIGTGSVRMFVAFYKGLPYEIKETTYLTDSAAQILKQKSSITAEQLVYLENHIASVPN